MRYSLTKQNRTDSLTNHERHIYCRGADNKFTFIPMPGFKSKFFAILVPFGAFMHHTPINNEKLLDLPPGTAHFLEHLIFTKSESLRQNDLDVCPLEELEKLVAEVNAYTSYDHTLFYIQTVDNFNLAASYLLQAILNFKSEQSLIDNEKKIIEQEILLDLEEAENKIYDELLRSLFNSHPIKDDIAGSVDDLKLINKEVIDAAYSYYYSKEKLNFIFVGDFDEELILEEILEVLYPNEDDNAIVTTGDLIDDDKEDRLSFFSEEAETVATKVAETEGANINAGSCEACENIELTFNQAKNLFLGSLDYPICHLENDKTFIKKEIEVSGDEEILYLGFKDSFFSKGQRLYGLDIEKRKLAAEIAFGILFGSSSQFYEYCNREALIDDSYFWQYVCYGDVGYFCLGSYTSNADALSTEIKKVISSYLEAELITEENFNRRKKMLIGNYIQEQDSIQDLGYLTARLNTQMMDGFHYSNMSNNLSMAEGLAVLKSVFVDSKLVEIYGRGK